MPTPQPHISVADLTAAGLHLRPAEAVAVARELMLRVSRGELAGIPSAHVIRLSGDGEIVVEGPVAAGHSVARAARLLEAMLPGFDAPPELRVPGALRLVLARALGTLDLPAYRTLDAFADALGRFTVADPRAAVGELVGLWCAAVDAASEPGTDAAPVPHEQEGLTISDVRRARRATGLTLAAVAERSRIPVSLLRELEWGYFANWPGGSYGRTQLVRYARAAGLDEQLIVAAVLPDIERFVTARAEQEPAAVDGIVLPEPEAPGALTLVQPAPLPVAAPPKRRGAPWVAALAIPVLLAVGFIPALWGSRDDTPVDVQQQAGRADASARGTGAAAEPTPGTEPGPATEPGPVTEPTATGAGPTAAAAQEAQKPQTTAPAESKALAPPRDVARGETAPPPAPPASSRPPMTSEDEPVQPAAVGTLGAGARPAALRANAAFSPAFATAGSAMFYHAEEDGGSAIMRADTDPSGAVLRITSIVNDNARNFHARPSPDGRRIAFDSDRDGERAVYVADANGQNVQRITGDGFAAVPSWSPGGDTLAYVRAEPNKSHVWNLWTTDLRTGETRRLTSHTVGQPWGGAWFPDGRRIAYSHENRLVVRSLDGGKDRVFMAPRKTAWIRTPAVSPDGNRIMFQIHRDGAWLLDLADGSMRKVLSDPTAEEFTWSPDGRRVAYHSRRTGKWGVWIMAPR